MKFALDTTAGVPLTEQLASQIEQMIRSRHLRSGVKLPSIRKMAADQQISRFPVIEAYELLAARGLIQPRHGSGFYVTDRCDADAHPGGADPRVAEEESSHILGQFASIGDRVKLSSGFMPAAWRDVDGIGQAMRHVMRSDAASLVDYAHPQGDPLLRQQLRRHLAPLGIDAQPQQILVTHSASQALDLVVRLMLKPGDTVFVEDPGYFNLFGLLKLHGVKLVGIPRRATGPDVEIAEALLREHHPKLFFVNTVFHNPTATNVAPQVMFRLLQLAHQHGFSIVEDDVYADFEATPSQRLATLDQLDRVIYLGGFSKTLSSSLRIGYLAARPDLIKHLVDVKALTSMGGARIAESVVAVLLERGTHRKHLERLRRRLAQASADTTERLRQAGWEVYEKPSGGMFVWARVPSVDDSARLVDTARTLGLDLAPGRDYRPNGEATPWVRLNVAAVSDPLAKPFVDAAGRLGRI